MTDHTKRDHALLSASSAHRWLACTPSALFEQCFAQEAEASPYAMEGTYAHEIAERTLLTALDPIERKYRNSKNPKYTLRPIVLKANKEGFDTVEMKQHARAYADYVQELVTRPDASIIVEQRVDFSTYVPGGFGTADCIIIQDDILTVVDFKYGKGVKVSAEHNPQMMLYALGAYEEYNILYDPKLIRMVIFQPRIDNISEYTMPTAKLLEIAETWIKPRAHLAIEGKGEFVAGEHCRFCKAKPYCQALKTYTEETVKNAFEDETIQAPETVKAEWPTILNRADIIIDWLNAVKAEAVKAMISGETVEGYKVVEGRAKRRYKNEDDVAEKLIGAGYNTEDIYDMKLKGITALTKILGKKEFDELLKDDLIRPKGAPTLALAADKRPEYTVADLFDEEGE